MRLASVFQEYYMFFTMATWTPGRSAPLHCVEERVSANYYFYMPYGNYTGVTLMWIMCGCKKQSSLSILWSSIAKKKKLFSIWYILYTYFYTGIYDLESFWIALFSPALCIWSLGPLRACTFQAHNAAKLSNSFLLKNKPIHNAIHRYIIHRIYTIFIIITKLTEVCWSIGKRCI